MYITISILILSAILFVSGKIRSDIVGLLSLILLLLLGIITPEEGLSGFSSSIVIMMVGLFVVGGAIFQTGLAKVISSKILKLAGTSELKLFILVMLVTSGIGAFVSNTGTVALMLPIIVSMASTAGLSPSRFLMPMAFASSMGGMMTLIGTPPNLVINEILINNGEEGLSFFSFLPVGIVCILTGLVILIPLSKKFLSGNSKKEGSKSKKKSLQDLAGEYKLTDNLFKIQINDDSPAIGKSIIELNVRRRYNLNILEIRPAGSTQGRFRKKITLLDPTTILSAGDILYVMGDTEHIELFSREMSLSILSSQTSDNQNKLDFYELGIAEVVLMATSDMINKTIIDVGIREKYHVTVLGIRRKKEYILNDLNRETLHSGDVLLVRGMWEDIGRLSEETSQWVVLGQPLEEAAKVTIDNKAPVAATIMIAMVLAMVFDFIPVAPVTAVLTAAILMVLTGCFKNVEAAYKTINWESIVLIASMLPMSIALEKTGTSEFISHALVSGLGKYGPMILLAGIYFTTSLMTMFISNTATAVLVAPIALSAAVELGVSPYPFLFAVTVAASMCFASPFSTPPNALVMPAGQYTFMSYIKVGLPLQIIMGVVMIFVLPIIFPF